MVTIPSTVRPLFVAAGWYPGRRVVLPPTFPVEHPAAEILSEFGGLSVGSTGAGEECAKSEIAFGFPSDRAPMADTWAGLLGTALVYVAEVHNGHIELYVDSKGRHFGLSMIHDAFWFEGRSFDVAIERILLGRRSQPMVRPDQDFVMLYGEKFGPDHPAVYKY